MRPRAWPPVGFALLMIGFGLRLDSDWQRLAGALLVAGTVAVGIGIWRGAPSRAAFVPPSSGG